MALQKIVPVAHSNARNGLEDELCVNKSNDLVLGSGYELNVHYFLVTLYLVVMISAIALNSSICYFYYAKYVRRNAFNKLVLNLAAGDLFATLGIIPFIFVSPFMLRHLPQNAANILCAFTTGKMLFLTGMAVSITTIALISIHRWTSVNFPMSAFTRLVQRDIFSYFGITFSWIFGVVLMSPMIFGRKFLDCQAMCMININNGAKLHLYFGVLIVLAYIIPMLILVITLVMSVRKLFWENSPAVGTVSRNVRRRVVVQLVAVILVLFSCWSPLLFYFTVAERHDVVSRFHNNYYRDARIMFVLVLVGLLQAVANPLLYGFRSPEFRRAVETLSYVPATLGETTPLM